MNRAVRAATIGVLLFTPVALAGCSAGQITQTATQNRDKYGAQALVGDLTIRDAALAYPDGGSYQAGEDVPLQMVVANPAITSDVLVSMSGPGFSGVRVAGTGVAVGSGQAGAPERQACAASNGGTYSAVSSSAAGTSSATASSSASSTASAGATGNAASASSGAGSGASSSGATSTGTLPPGVNASSSPTATGALPSGILSSTSPLPTPAGSADHVGITIPATCTVALGEDVPHVFLTGLTQRLSAAAIVPVTMTFERAGTVTVPFIVAPPSQVIPNTSSYNFEQGKEAGSGANKVEQAGSGG